MVMTTIWLYVTFGLDLAFLYVMLSCINDIYETDLDIVTNRK